MTRATAFACLLASDLRFGCRAIVGRLAIAYCLSILLGLLLSLQAISTPDYSFSLGFADYYAALFAGMGEYNPRQGTPFKLPAGWICICALAAYTVLDYPTRDLNGLGTQTIVAIGNRWYWWLSKCVWTLMTCFIFWLVTLAACATTTALLKGTFTLRVSTELPDLLKFFAASDAPVFLEKRSTGAWMALTPLALAALCIVQNTLSFVASPLIGFAATIAQLLAASFFLNPALLGNYLMLARSNLLIANGVDVAVGTLLSLVTIVVGVCAGGHLFARHDILGREFDVA